MLDRLLDYKRVYIRSKTMPLFLMLLCQHQSLPPQPPQNNQVFFLKYLDDKGASPHSLFLLLINWYIEHEWKQQ